MRRFNFIFVALIDITSFITFSLLSFFIRFYIFRFGRPLELRNLEAFISTLPFLVLLFLILFYLYGLYTEKESWYDCFSSILSAVFLLFLLKLSLSFFMRAFAYPRSVMFISSILESLGFLGWRYFLFIREKERKKEETAVVLGKEEIYERYGKYKFIRVKSIDEIQKIDERIDAIFITEDGFDKKRVMEFALKERIKLFISPDISDLIVFSSKFLGLSERVFIEFSKFNLSKEERILKRVIDIILSILLLIIFSPLFVIIPILIKLTSRGRVFYIQKRVGEGGKIFNLIKFRTMVEEAEKETGPVLSTRNDPRITGIGKVLRKTHLDEIPQLINVLKGEMSLVGPRPARPELFKDILKKVPEFEYRLRLKPGITGLAQVIGKYDIEPEEKIKYDLIYISTWSPFLDFYILLMTLKKVVGASLV